MKIAMEVSYDGSNYSGFQRQQNARAIQNELEHALTQLTGESITVHGSGRTDAGVHALGQIVHFKTTCPIPINKWALALKNYLPEDIIIRRAVTVADDFHVRYDAIGKYYRYTIDRGTVPNVFQRHFSYHYSHPLDIVRIHHAIPQLIGTHDFSAFCASRTSIENKVRTVHAIDIIEMGDMLHLDFRGNGFLYHMVRILVGTLIRVGNGRLEPQQLTDILVSKDRHRAGPTAPAHGLTLMEVLYRECIWESK